MTKTLDIEELGRLGLMNPTEIKAEAERCLDCESKPCMKACPAKINPCRFIRSMRVARPSDFQRAAAQIYEQNPLGAVCGALCSDLYCVAACTRKKMDFPIQIPRMQASIIQAAKLYGKSPDFNQVKTKKVMKTVAVIGAGVAGLTAAAILSRSAEKVVVYEKSDKIGGSLLTVSNTRMNQKLLETDIEFVKSLGNVEFVLSSSVVTDAASVKALKGSKGYDAVMVCVGRQMGACKVGGAECGGAAGPQFMACAEAGQKAKGKDVAIVYDGGKDAMLVADCAFKAKECGAKSVTILSAKSTKTTLLPTLTAQLIDLGVNIIPNVVVETISKEGDAFLMKANGGSFQMKADLSIGCTETEAVLADDASDAKIVYCGDLKGKKVTIMTIGEVKNAASALIAKFDASVKAGNGYKIEGYNHTPVSLETDYYGVFKMKNPFILSASPYTDGYDQMKLCFEHGWGGGVIKTAFDGLPIHIPDGYMSYMAPNTMGNCDNVSGRHLDQCVADIKRLVKEYPDHLTIGATGGPVTGNKAHDKAGWQANTRKLDQSGCHGVEYSLSCPQGGDGSEGAIVSQNAELAAEIIGWILEAADPNIPHFFKLTSAVTSIVPILKAIKATMAKYPNKKAGIVLANSFAAYDVRGVADPKSKWWDSGKTIGMHGEGVLPISYAALASAQSQNMYISGNGGPMNYIQGANFLALGVRNVQMCTIAYKYGYTILQELTEGLSTHMKEYGFKGIDEVINCSAPHPITDFMEMTSNWKLSEHTHYDACISCDQCTRCPYLAISKKKFERGGKVVLDYTTDAKLCIGCSICAKLCPTGVITMRERVAGEERASH